MCIIEAYEGHKRNEEMTMAARTSDLINWAAKKRDEELNAWKKHKNAVLDARGAIVLPNDVCVVDIDKSIITPSGEGCHGLDWEAIMWSQNTNEMWAVSNPGDAREGLRVVVREVTPAERAAAEAELEENRWSYYI